MATITEVHTIWFVFTIALVVLLQSSTVYACWIWLQTAKQEAKPKQAVGDNAEQAQKFLADMSHEIRTPMSAILASLELLRDADTPDEVAPQLARPRRKTCTAMVQHMLALTGDVLDLKKIKSGNFEVETIECQLGELLRDIMKLVEHRAEAKSLFFDLIYRTPLPQQVQTDPTTPQTDIA